jgi:hypothetical protein
MSIPVLFLDFDGVLNSEQQIRRDMREPNFNPNRSLIELDTCSLAVSNLKYIFECVPNLKIVIHSTRRKRFSLKDIFIGQVDHQYDDRHEGISNWLKKHPEVLNYVILDDSPIQGPQDRILYTDPTNGLTLSNSKDIVDMLGGLNDPNFLKFI